MTTAGFSGKAPWSRRVQGCWNLWWRATALMMIHGTGGGFDQGLLFATGLRRSAFQIVAPSRFGYLGSAFPEDASPARQADTLVELLDHLGIDRMPVAGGSEGALTAAEFALRHPDRCSHLVLIVPISRKVDGLRTDGFWAGTPSPTAYERIAVPTLILSCEDDLFGTAETARLLADRIPDARLTVYHDGGHTWLGHDDALTGEIANFLMQTGRS